MLRTDFHWGKALLAGVLLVFLANPALTACSYKPYPDGEPRNHAECIEKSTRNFQSGPDAERARILTEKSCDKLFPEH